LSPHEEKRMRKPVLLAVLSVAVLSGLLYGDARSPVTGGAFICPLTGEPLPCPKCCPLNHAPQLVHDDGVRTGSLSP
jgi:hypothetical protein